MTVTNLLSSHGKEAQPPL